jgi:hypothetical protein
MTEWTAKRETTNILQASEDIEIPSHPPHQIHFLDLSIDFRYSFSSQLAANEHVLFNNTGLRIADATDIKTSGQAVF